MLISNHFWGQSPDDVVPPVLQELRIIMPLVYTLTFCHHKSEPLATKTSAKISPGYSACYFLSLAVYPQGHSGIPSLMAQNPLPVLHPSSSYIPAPSNQAYSSQVGVAPSSYSPQPQPLMQSGNLKENLLVIEDLDS